MGLAVSVGDLAAAIADRDAHREKSLRHDFAQINRLLKKNNLPEHHEPETLAETPDFSPLIGFPYNYLHRLRRVLAYQRAGIPLSAVDPQADLRKDKILRAEYDKRSDSHLIHHSDSGGYYIPLAFDEPLRERFLHKAPGGAIGSSQRLLDELRLIAPAIRIPLVEGRLTHEKQEALFDELEENGADPFFEERQVWLVLFIAATESVRLRASIRFS